MLRGRVFFAPPFSHTSTWTLGKRDRKHEPSTLRTESLAEEGQISAMPNNMKPVYRYFDEIEMKDAMQQTFIRFATYLIAPAPQAGVPHNSFTDEFRKMAMFASNYLKENEA